MSKLTDFSLDFIVKFQESVNDLGRFIELLQNISEDDMIYLYLVIRCNINGEDVYEVAKGL